MAPTNAATIPATVPTMLKLIPLFLALALPASARTLWHFPGPQGPELQAAAAKAASGTAPGLHLITDAEIATYLSAREIPNALGCLDDTTTCEDPRIDALRILGLTARVDVTAAQEADGHRVTLTINEVGAKAPKVLQGQGDTLAGAMSAAFAQLAGQGTLRVTVQPADAKVFIDDVEVRQGSGDVVVSPGSHRVRVERAGQRALEQPFTIKKGQIVTASFEMASADGELVLSVVPKDARVFIDGAHVADISAPIPLPPGEHLLRFEADGHDPLERKLVVKTGVRSTLKVGLQESLTAWQDKLRTPHPDTIAYPAYVRAGLRFTSVFDGPVDVAVGRRDERIEVISQDDSLGVLGLEIGAGWRGRYLAIDALTLSYEAGGGTRSLTTKPENTADDEVGIENMSRLSLRPAWFGLRYPAWRLDPYVMGGAVLAFQSFEVVRGDTRRTASTRAFKLGLEAGVRFQISPRWFASGRGIFDFWFEERTTAAFVLGVGYALDFPEWL